MKSSSTHIRGISANTIPWAIAAAAFIALPITIAVSPGHAFETPPTLEETSSQRFECVLEIDPDDSYTSRPWSGGFVPFQFDEDINSTEQNHIKAAMDWWTLVTGTKFVYRNTEPDFVTITRHTETNVSSSAVGFKGGEQFVKIGTNHWTNYGVIAHELCHTLGWHHEQSRPDRDEFVTIDTLNVNPDYIGNFNIYENDLTFGHPYDFESIMHYGACTFSICSSCESSDPDCRTITTLDPDFQETIGQRGELSDGDIDDVRYIYGSRTARYVSLGGNGSGSLSNPYGEVPTALSAIPNGGYLLIDAGIYLADGLFTKKSIWKSHGGAALVK